MKIHPHKEEKSEPWDVMEDTIDTPYEDRSELVARKRQKWETTEEDSEQEPPLRGIRMEERREISLDVPNEEDEGENV